MTHPKIEDICNCEPISRLGNEISNCISSILESKLPSIGIPLLPGSVSNLYSAATI